MIRKRNKAVIVLFVACLVVLFSAGCSMLGNNYSKTSRYVLDISGERRETPSRLPDSALAVRKFGISPLFEAKSFVYRQADLSYQQDYYNEFFTEPATLITEEVKSGLASSNLFAYVASFPAQLDVQFVLDGAVTALYGDYRVKDTPRAVLGIEFALLYEGPEAVRIRFKKAYEESVPIEAEEPTALVNGWNAALKAILKSLEDDLSRTDLKNGNDS